ncbi:MAG: tetratricopeptide repeat protein [Alphaproteobacteria bacterium]
MAETITRQRAPARPEEAARHFAAAVEHHQAGRVQAAHDAYQEALRADPRHGEALSMFGLLALQVSRPADAVRLFRLAVRVEPERAGWWNNLGVALIQAGHPKQAEEAFARATTLDPDDAEAQFNLGSLARQRNDTPAAIAAWRRAVALKPTHFEAALGLATLLFAAGDWWGALAAADLAVAAKPDHLAANYGRALSLQRLGRDAEAEAAFRRVTEADPEAAAAMADLGRLLASRGRPAEAEATYRRGLEAAPDAPLLWNNLGALLLGLPGRAEDALVALERAVALKPDMADAHFNRGAALQTLERLEPSIAAYRDAVAADPEHAQALPMLGYQLRHACLWDEAAALGPRIDRIVDKALAAGRPSPEPAFVNVVRAADWARNAAIARSCAGDIARRFPPAWTHDPAARGDGARPLTIGYLSNDFRNHAVGHQVHGLFALHDRARFRVHAYSYGKDDGSHVRRDFMRDADAFVDLRDMDDRAAAARIHDDGVDVLVDLTGWTAHTRLEIAAQRPAPVQISWLGFPGTLGGDFFDYMVVDRAAVPEEADRHFSETLIILPHTYMPTDTGQKVSAWRFRRAEFDLPDEAVVFASHNQAFKTDPETFAAWMEILRRAPRSVLWLGQVGSAAFANLQQRAEAAGIAPTRLVRARRLRTRAQHLARLRLADLALDTRLYGGHSTTVDALWAGLPVLTVRGPTFAGRASSGIVAAAGLPDMAVDTLPDYVDRAVALAHDRVARSHLRNRLLVARHVCPLFDARRFVANLEAGIARAYGTWREGRRPAAIVVADDGPVGPVARAVA